MADFIRDYFGLTQQRLAEWLGVHRVVVAQVEGGQRGLPLGPALRRGAQDARFLLAAHGNTLGPDGAVQPGPPPLALPPPNTGPVLLRLAACRQQAARLAGTLATARTRAACFGRRLAALPALRAYAGPVPDPDGEAAWLALFETEAVTGLRYTCGPGAQRLLEARIAGLEREAELLAEWLASEPPAG